jgi:hypothetical protein
MSSFEHSGFIQDKKVPGFPERVESRLKKMSIAFAIMLSPLALEAQNKAVNPDTGAKTEKTSPQEAKRQLEIFLTNVGGDNPMRYPATLDDEANIVIQIASAAGQQAAEAAGLVLFSDTNGRLFAYIVDENGNKLLLNTLGMTAPDIDAARKKQNEKSGKKPAATGGGDGNNGDTVVDSPTPGDGQLDDQFYDGSDVNIEHKKKGNKLMNWLRKRGLTISASAAVSLGLELDMTAGFIHSGALDVTWMQQDDQWSHSGHIENYSDVSAEIWGAEFMRMTGEHREFIASQNLANIEWRKFDQMVQNWNALNELLRAGDKPDPDYEGKTQFTRNAAGKTNREQLVEQMKALQKRVESWQPGQ